MKPTTNHLGSKVASCQLEGEAEAGSMSEGEFRLWPAWEAQLRQAIIPELEEAEQGGPAMYQALFLHYTSVTWKLLFVMIPPAPWCGGYPTFIMALAFIVGMVAILKEVGRSWCTVSLCVSVFVCECVCMCLCVSVKGHRVDGSQVSGFLGLRAAGGLRPLEQALACKHWGQSDM